MQGLGCLWLIFPGGFQHFSAPQLKIAFSKANAVTSGFGLSQLSLAFLCFQAFVISFWKAESLHQPLFFTRKVICYRNLSLTEVSLTPSS